MEAGNARHRAQNNAARPPAELEAEQAHATTAQQPALHPSSDDDDEPVNATTEVTAAPPTTAAAEEDNNEEEESLNQRVRAEEERHAAEARNREAAERLGGTARLVDSKAAHRRLMRDLRSLQTTLASPAGEGLGLSAHPINGDLFHWRSVISGPEGSAWEGGLFKLDLVFSERYPLEPPHVRFLTKNVFHPNVYVDGNICLDTLKSAWSPTLDVEGLLLSITSLLSDPNPKSAANGAAARMLEENVTLYNERVRAMAEESLEQSFSDMEGDDNDEEDEEEKG